MNEELNKTVMNQVTEWLGKRSECKAANECIDMYAGYMYGIGRKPNVTQDEYYAFVEKLTGTRDIYYSIVERLIGAIVNS